jgi:membrane-associated phospholipid phosphatase
LKLLKENIFFFGPYLLFLALGLFAQLYYSQVQIFWWVNRHNNSSADVFMYYYTNVGDGLFMIAAGVVLAFFSIRKGIALIAGFIVSGLIVQLGKRFVFPEHVRPWKTLAEQGDLHLVNNYIPYSNNSFPSGHTTSAFCMFALIAMMSQRKLLALPLFLAACLVAYARIYLSQHYFGDTYFGSIIGVVTAVLVYLYLFENHRLKQISSLDKPIYKIFR